MKHRLRTPIFVGVLLLGMLVASPAIRAAPQTPLVTTDCVHNLCSSAVKFTGAKIGDHTTLDPVSLFCTGCATGDFAKDSLILTGSTNGCQTCWQIEAGLEVDSTHQTNPYYFWDDAKPNGGYHFFDLGSMGTSWPAPDEVGGAVDITIYNISSSEWGVKIGGPYQEWLKDSTPNTMVVNSSDSAILQSYISLVNPTEKGVALADFMNDAWYGGSPTHWHMEASSTVSVTNQGPNGVCYGAWMYKPNLTPNGGYFQARCGATA